MPYLWFSEMEDETVWNTRWVYSMHVVNKGSVNQEES